MLKPSRLIPSLLTTFIIGLILTGSVILSSCEKIDNSGVETNVLPNPVASYNFSAPANAKETINNDERQYVFELFHTEQIHVLEMIHTAESIDEAILLTDNYLYEDSELPDYFRKQFVGLYMSLEIRKNEATPNYAERMYEYTMMMAENASPELAIIYDNIVSLQNFIEDDELSKIASEAVAHNYKKLSAGTECSTCNLTQLKDYLSDEAILKQYEDHDRRMESLTHLLQM